MINLPVEVLRLIFHSLGSRDQLECMTVCRQWHDIIQDRVLFCTIYIRSQKQLNYLIDRVQKDSTLGRKVERFTLQQSTKTWYNAEIFTELFPNLRDFTVLNTIQEMEIRDTKLFIPLESHPWCNRIEKMVENLSDLNTRILLLSGLCKNLTYIAVTGDMGEPARGLIEALANAPALKTLRLNGYSMSFDDLELLHENAPLIDTLLLKNISFPDLSTPRDIQPATLVKRFHFVSFYSLRNPVAPHLPYISRKYTHVEELLFEIKIPNTSPANDLYIQYLNTMAQTAVLFKPYLKALAPHLKSLSLCVWDRSSVHFDFNILDECDCQIKEMHLTRIPHISMLEQLSNTTQVQSIQSLTIRKMNDDYSTYFISLEWLRNFTKLKELSLDGLRSNTHMKKPQLDLNNLMNILSGKQLEALKLYNMELTFEELNITTLAYPSLESLTLSQVTLKPGTDAFIQQLFPNLSFLVLDSISYRNRRNTFTSPQIDLSYREVLDNIKNENLFMLPQIELCYLEVSDKFTILVSTLDNNQQHLYTTDKTPIYVYNDIDDTERGWFSCSSFSSKRYVGSPGVPYFTVVCKAVSTVSLRNSSF